MSRAIRTPSIDASAKTDAIVFPESEGGFLYSLKAGDWKYSVPPMMDSVFSQVLYRQYRKVSRDSTSFTAYLSKYGTGVPKNYDGVFMTDFKGAKVFDLRAGIPMRTHYVPGRWSSVLSNRSDKINEIQGVSDGNIPKHDLLSYDAIDTRTGALKQNQYAGRAIVCFDFVVGYVLGCYCTDNVKETLVTEQMINNAKGHHYKHTADVKLLKLEPCKDMNGDANPADPFFAFDSPVLVDGVSDQIGPKKSASKKALSAVRLKSTTFSYTGKRIRPAITVKCGKKTVPASAYKVSYTDNKAIGQAAVTVTGKGKYAGTVTKSFRIVPKGTTIKKVKRSKTKATLKWKKQSAKMPKARIAGYQIRYSKSSSMKNAKTVKVKGYKKTTRKIKHLKKKTKYYFQVRTYIKKDKKTIYSKWSKKKAA